MDLAPFARMDDPVPLPTAETTDDPLKPQRRRRFNEDDDEDDDDEVARVPASHMKPLEEDTGNHSETLVLGEEEKRAETHEATLGDSLAADSGNTSFAAAPSLDMGSRDSPDFLRDVSLEGPSIQQQQPLSSPGASSFVSTKSVDSPIRSPVKRKADDLDTSFGSATPTRALENAERNRATEPSVFWAEHRDWLRSVLPITKVSVDEPLQMPRTLTNPNPPVTYLVRTSVCDEGVRRRYSDFEVVRISLISRFPGIMVFALPEKKAVGNTGPEFLKERAKRLEMFLKSVLLNEYLRTDVILRTFIMGSPAEWESAKKRAGVSSSQAGATSGPPAGQMSSEDRWRSAVHMSQLPEKHEEEVRKAAESINKLELGLKNLVAAAAKCAQVARQNAAALKDLQNAFAFTLSSMQGPMEFWTDCAKLEPILVEDLLQQALENEYEMVAEMRRMMDARRDLVMQADQKLAVLHKYEDERQQFEKTGQLDKAQRSAQKVQDAQKQVKQADYRLETFTRALFLNGLLSFPAERVERVSRALSTFAFGELRLLDLVKSVWLGIVASLRMDPAQLEIEAQGPMRELAQRVPDKFKPVFSAGASSGQSGGAVSAALPSTEESRLSV